MSHYKPYPAYKDSGVEWLGQMPRHWQVKKVSHVSAVIDPQPDHRAPALSEGDGFPYVGIRDINSDGSVNFSTARKVNEDAIIKQESSFRLNENDIIFCKVGTLGIPRFIKPNGRMALSATLVLIKPSPEVNPAFLLYSLDSRALYGQIEYFSSGSTRAALGIEQIRSFSILLPSRSEQDKISQHLDRETARIDALVEKKTRFIELLREKRQALITHAVTKGLDPNVKMKDSGVEWLGEVPEHWRVSKLKHNLREQLSYGANEAAEQDDPENPRFIRITDLNEDGTLKDETFKSLPMTVASPYLLLDGDVLLARSGATVGKSFLYKDSMGLACYAGYLIRARFDRQKISPRYFWHITNSGYYWDFISGSNIQSTIQNVSGEKYGNLWIATPSLEEQEEIAEKIDCESARFELLIGRTEKSIELLRERRSALITAAVTGQIDLREPA